MALVSMSPPPSGSAHDPHRHHHPLSGSGSFSTAGSASTAAAVTPSSPSHAASSSPPHVSSPAAIRPLPSLPVTGKGATSAAAAASGGAVQSESATAAAPLSTSQHSSSSANTTPSASPQLSLQPDRHRPATITRSPSAPPQTTLASSPSAAALALELGPASSAASPKLATDSTLLAASQLSTSPSPTSTGSVRSLPRVPSFPNSSVSAAEQPRSDDMAFVQHHPQYHQPHYAQQNRYAASPLQQSHSFHQMPPARGHTYHPGMPAGAHPHHWQPHQPFADFGAGYHAGPFPQGSAAQREHEARLRMHQQWDLELWRAQQQQQQQAFAQAHAPSPVHQHHPIPPPLNTSMRRRTSSGPSSATQSVDSSQPPSPMMRQPPSPSYPPGAARPATPKGSISSPQGVSAGLASPVSPPSAMSPQQHSRLLDGQSPASSNEASSAARVSGHTSNSSQSSNLSSAHSHNDAATTSTTTTGSTSTLATTTDESSASSMGSHTTASPGGEHKAGLFDAPSKEKANVQRQSFTSDEDNDTLVVASPPSAPPVQQVAAPVEHPQFRRESSHQQHQQPFPTTGSQQWSPAPPPLMRERTESTSASSSRSTEVVSMRSVTPTAGNAVVPRSLGSVSADDLHRHDGLQGPSPLPVAADELSMRAPDARPSMETPSKKNKKGVGSKLRKAFSMSTVAPLADADIDGRGPTSVRRDASSSSNEAEENGASVRRPETIAYDAQSTFSGHPGTRSTKSGRLGMLSAKMNRSTDNLSISSTVSSASVMIRKLGNMGSKLARRNTLSGLTKAFRSKDDGDASAGPSSKRKGASTASVSLATAELDDMGSVRSGISPAAAFAKRQQALYAEQEAAAAEARRLAEEREAAMRRHQRTDSDVSRRSMPWQRKPSSLGDEIATGSVGSASGKNKLLEREKEKLRSRKGRRWRFGGGSTSGKDSVDDSASLTSASEHGEPRFSVDAQPPSINTAYHAYGGSFFDDEAVQEMISPGGVSEDDDADEAGDDEQIVPVRPVVTHRLAHIQVRGILKAKSYNQEDYLSQTLGLARHRSQSCDEPQQLGVSPSRHSHLSHIPTEAQVDGVASTDVPRHSTDEQDSPVSYEAPNAVFSQPALNASAPVLHTQAPAALAKSSRSASTPGVSRKISFAPSLSVHTTWPAAVYDRRAEPAACNRLTAAFAQRIKEELNAFKMEEMEVHPMSRQLTHFFV